MLVRKGNIAAPILCCFAVVALAAAENPPGVPPAPEQLDLTGDDLPRIPASRIVAELDSDRFHPMGRHLAPAMPGSKERGDWLGEQHPAGRTKLMEREWTSTGEAALRAEFLGVQGENVVLRLPDGNITLIPLLKLTNADSAFVKENHFEYHVAWQGWPTDAQVAVPVVEVKESIAAADAFVYTTAHFRFRSNVHLGTALMQDLAKVFELTYDLHTKSPFGILSKPKDDVFEARLFGTLQQYRAAGGPATSAGVYILKDRIFLAPLDFMGIKAGPDGYSKVSAARYDPSPIIHEITHMLTNDMLVNLPLWLNEGYAEYISSFQLEGGAFKVNKQDIKQGVLDRFVRDHEKQLSHGRIWSVKLNAAQRKDFLKGKFFPLFHVAKVLTMTDREWLSDPPASEPRRQTRPGSPPVTVAPPRSRISEGRISRLYRTAHLILYYFIQIEGEQGVRKFSRFLELNRRQLARYDQYLDDYKTFQEQVKEFMKLPGVTLLPDNRLQYPSNLSVPREPTPPCADPNRLKLAGIEALLDGETAAVVGRRIEDALRQDLGLDLQFANE